MSIEHITIAKIKDLDNEFRSIFGPPTGKPADVGMLVRFYIFYRDRRPSEESDYQKYIDMKIKQAFDIAKSKHKITKHDLIRLTEEYESNGNKFITRTKPVKQKVNDKCSCGSGLKYKKCCMLNG